MNKSDKTFVAVCLGWCVVDLAAAVYFLLYLNLWVVGVICLGLAATCAAILMYGLKLGDV